MNTQEQKLQEYNESKELCMAYISYKGDKRRSYYKRLERAVFEVCARRVTNFGKQLGLPTFNDLLGF